MAQLTAFFSLETMETRRSQNNTVIKTEKNCNLKILYLTKLLFKMGEIKTF